MTKNGTSTAMPCNGTSYRVVLLDTLAYGAIMIGLCWLLVSGASRMGYNWQWYQVPKYIATFHEGFTPGPLLKGLMVTLEITAISLLLTVVLGLGAALARLSDSWAARAVARLYLETIRNSPLLIQIFVMYFVISPILDIPAFWSAVISLR